MPSCFLHTNFHGLLHLNVYPTRANVKCIHRISAAANDFLGRLKVTYFLLLVVEKEADFLPGCHHCSADCLLYWQYFKMYVALMYGSRLCKERRIVSSRRRPKRTNIVTLTWQKMKDVDSCLSRHSVYLESVVYETKRVYFTVLFLCNIMLILHDYKLGFFLYVILKGIPGQDTMSVRFIFFYS